jgi:protein involved in polysaccharide export with SLBB domain
MKREVRVIVVAALLAGVATTHAVAQSREVALPVGAPRAGADARIHPGDQVVVQIWREPDMSGAFTVDESGEVVLPRLGGVHATEMSAAELQDSVRAALGRYLRNPAIEVTLLRRIGVHGEVRNPDLYLLDLTMTLREVIAKAGGITDAGNPNRITIIRGGEQIELPSDRRAQFVTAELRSGDQIVVGRRSWIAMNPLAVISTGTALVSFFVGVVLPLIN